MHMFCVDMYSLIVSLLFPLNTCKCSLSNFIINKLPFFFYSSLFYILIEKCSTIGLSTWSAVVIWMVLLISTDHVVTTDQLLDC